MSELTEADLKRLVDAFYARVRQDAMLGPIFNGAIHDWPEHLERLQAFWSSVMLTSGRYKGQPVPAHVRHEAAMQDKASRIAESLSLGIDFYRNRARTA